MPDLKSKIFLPKLMRNPLSAVASNSGQPQTVGYIIKKRPAGNYFGRYGFQDEGRSHQHTKSKYKQQHYAPAEGRKVEADEEAKVRKGLGFVQCSIHI